MTYDTCPPAYFDTVVPLVGCANAPGQLVQAAFGISIPASSLSFEYNYAYAPAGEVTGKTLELWSNQAHGTLTASYTYDSQGALTSMTYPPGESWPTGGSGQTLTYTLDAMERPIGIGGPAGVTYNAANQPLYDGTATRTYNNLLQMTSIVASGMSMTYKYSSTQNNGQITSSVDAITGETITYQYDALKRLLSASGKNWGETYTYDGYGNLTNMLPTGTAGAPTLRVNVALDSNDVPTSRISAVGGVYDNNGN